MLRWTLEVRIFRLKNRYCIGFRDRQDACPTASIRIKFAGLGPWRFEEVGRTGIYFCTPIAAVRS